MNKKKMILEFMWKSTLGWNKWGGRRLRVRLCVHPFSTLRRWLKISQRGESFTSWKSANATIYGLFSFLSESLVVKHFPAYKWVDTGQSRWKAQMIPDVSETHSTCSFTLTWATFGIQPQTPNQKAVQWILILSGRSPFDAKNNPGYSKKKQKTHEAETFPGRR